LILYLRVGAPQFERNLSAKAQSSGLTAEKNCALSLLLPR